MVYDFSNAGRELSTKSNSASPLSRSSELSEVMVVVVGWLCFVIGQGEGVWWVIGSYYTVFWLCSCSEWREVCKMAPHDTHPHNSTISNHKQDLTFRALLYREASPSPATGSLQSRLIDGEHLLSLFAYNKHLASTT
jgi:hypothetical protein